MSAAAPWLGRFRQRSSPELRLFCFPFAGGSSAAFQNWSDGLPDWVEVVPVELPGRQARFAEKPFDQIGNLTKELADALSGELGRRFAFYGHSMGALVAFELAHMLRERGHHIPEILFVAAHRAPRFPHETRVSELPDQQLVAHLEELSGNDFFRRNEALLQLVLPTLRADLAICDSYHRAERAPLDCPIVALNGAGDAMLPAEIEAWREESLGPFKAIELPGGHFFITTHEQALLAALSEQLVRQREQEP